VAALAMATHLLTERKLHEKVVRKASKGFSARESPLLLRRSFSFSREKKRISLGLGFL